MLKITIMKTNKQIYHLTDSLVCDNLFQIILELPNSIK